MSTVRAVVLTAIPAEFRAMHGMIRANAWQTTPAGLSFAVGSVQSVDQDWSWDVWLTRVGMGNIGAALQASQAIQELNPELMIFVGVAGSLKSDVELGDVVVANQVLGYERGKETDGQFLPRAESFPVHRRVQQAAIRIADEGQWTERVTSADKSSRLPIAHVAGIAAGEKVVASERGETAARLRSFYSSASAVEMEGIGFLSAAHYWDGTPALVVRGISDRLGDKDAASDLEWQPQAARNASAFTAELLSIFPPGSFLPGRTTPEATVGEPESVDARSHMRPVDRIIFEESRFELINQAAASDEPPGLAEDFAQPAPGQLIDRKFRLEAPIGQGAWGAVWTATEVVFGDEVGRVAVKLQCPDRGRRVDYLRREAVRLATLRGPYIIPFRGAGTIASGEFLGWRYLATDLAQSTLQDLLAAGVLPYRTVMEVTLDVAQGLAAVHSSGHVHGDVKPSNILRYQGSWTLGDFGLSRPFGNLEPEGTLGYMAPEVFGGHVAEPADVYSLGVTARVALSNEWVDNRRTIDSTQTRVWKFLTDGERQLPRIPDEVPERLHDLLVMCSNVDPKRRPSVETLIATISDLLHNG